MSWSHAMGYAKGVRLGHAGGHLRGPVCDLVEALYARDPRWWEVEDGDGVPFASPAAAHEHLGRLWHCSDIVPSDIRRAAEDIVGSELHLWTYAALVHALRPVVAEEMMSSGR